MAHNRFKHGSGVYQCAVCQRRTRATVESCDDVGYCGPCYDLAGLQNSMWDDGQEDWIVKARDGLLAKIIRGKGNEQAVRSHFSALFTTPIPEAQ